MPDTARLLRLLDRLDGRPYPAYRDLEGSWRIDDLTLHVDRVQGDPFAAPSRVRVSLASGLGPHIIEDPDRRLAAEDWYLRRFGHFLSGQRRGSGRSGELQVYRPGPEIVQRSAVRLFADGRLEVRFSAGLPARGRRILGRQAQGLLLDDIPLAARALVPTDQLDEHVASVEQQRQLRRELAANGLVAFVADGSVLPRASGIDPRPLDGAIPFTS
ncbi:MAG: ABC-ATPase domain-containing protein, partial [Myxococcota bacterium]|nr:ABC-ATPase domain-containing protein [Myxococcota bacterium]